MRLVDMVLTFPAILRLVTIVSARWPSIRTVMLVIGLLGWLPVALVRAGRFLTLRGQLADDLSRHPAEPVGARHHGDVDAAPVPPWRGTSGGTSAASTVFDTALGAKILDV